MPAAGAPALAAEGNVGGSAVEDFTYPNDDVIPGIKLSRGDGRIELVDCANGGAGLLRVRSSVRDEEFCFDVKGPGGYLALELHKTYQLRGDGENHVEAEVTVDGVPQPDPVTVPDAGWATLPVKAGSDNTLVELRSLDAEPSGKAEAPGPYRFMANVHVGDPADGGRACSGALVHRLWVLTSKQCFVEQGQPWQAGRPQRPTTVTIGRSDVSGPGDGFVLSAIRVVPHPDRDVALVKLGQRAWITPTVSLATTPPQPGEVLQVAGYGRTGTEWTPATAHAAGFTVTGVTGASVDIAGQDTAQVGPCQGDAGGPGLRLVNGVAELVAVTSAAGMKGCRGAAAAQAAGGTMTRVDDIVSWVRGTTAMWNARQVSVTDDRVGLLRGDNGAQVIEGDPTGAGTELFADAKEVIVADDRIGVLTNGGVAYVKEVGAASSAFVKEYEGVQQLAISGNRIGIVTTDGTAMVKEGGLSSRWYTQNTNIKQIAVTDARVGVLTNANIYLVKDTALNATTPKWVTEYTNVQQIALAANRIGLVAIGGVAQVKEGGLSASWVPIGDADAKSIALGGDRVGVLTTGSLFKFNEGALQNPVRVAFSEAQHMSVSGNRLGVVTLWGTAFVRTGDSTAGWVSVW